MEHAQQFEDSVKDYQGNSIYGCYFLSDGIKFHGNFRDSDDLPEIRYVAAPPTLVNTSDLHGDINQIVWASLYSEVQLTVASVGTGLNAYCATAGTALFDIYRKSSGALLYAGIRMTRTSLTFATTDLQAADVVQLASFQQGGFTGDLNTLTSGYSSELMILPAEQQNHIPLSPSAVNMLQAQVVQRVILAQGDTEMYAVEKARAKENQKKLEMIHNDRLSGEARTIPMNNGLLNAIRRPGRYRRN
jgi:hypothetical protein